MANLPIVADATTCLSTTLYAPTSRSWVAPGCYVSPSMGGLSASSIGRDQYDHIRFTQKAVQSMIRLEHVQPVGRNFNTQEPDGARALGGYFADFTPGVRRKQQIMYGIDYDLQFNDRYINPYAIVLPPVPEEFRSNQFSPTMYPLQNVKYTNRHYPVANMSTFRA